jgi:CRP-like cAMP-binding protein
MDTFDPTQKDFLATASDDLRKLISGLAKEQKLARGDVLFEQGDTGDSLFAILSGALEFSVISSDGRKMTLDVMRKGAVFGEISLFDPGERTATVTAIEPAQIWAVRNADVLTALKDNPAIGLDMIQLAGRRMRWMGTQLSEQVFLSLPVRLARKILHLTEGAADENPTLKLSQAELAEFVSASREAVSKILAVWKREKIVNLPRGGVQVLDRASLKELGDFQIY